MNSSHCPGLRLRPAPAEPEAGRRPGHRAAKQHRGYFKFGREKSVYYAFRLISCRQRLGTRPGGLGEIQLIQAVTSTQRPGSLCDPAAPCGDRAGDRDRPPADQLET